MAQLDLSHAHIIPVYANPGKFSYLGLNDTASTHLRNASGTELSDGSKNLINTAKDTFKIQYSGTFKASGTEFYIAFSNYNVWKVTNVSFSSGDTYSFIVKANIMLNT